MREAFFSKESFAIWEASPSDPEIFWTCRLPPGCVPIAGLAAPGLCGLLVHFPKEERWALAALGSLTYIPKHWARVLLAKLYRQ